MCCAQNFGALEICAAAVSEKIPIAFRSDRYLPDTPVISGILAIACVSFPSKLCPGWLFRYLSLDPLELKIQAVFDAGNGRIVSRYCWLGERKDSHENGGLPNHAASIKHLLLICRKQILAVPDQIKQVFLNVLNNAADDCLDRGGVITVSTWREDKTDCRALELSASEYQLGAPGGIRTPDTRLRRPVLYPAELRVRAAVPMDTMFGIGGQRY